LIVRDAKQKIKEWPKGGVAKSRDPLLNFGNP